jgi:hypothetical protein
MPIELLSLYTLYTLKQNQVYAMPASKLTLNVECPTLGTVLQVSTRVDFSTFYTSTHVFGERFSVTAPFIRITNADTEVHIIPSVI